MKILLTIIILFTLTCIIYFGTDLIKASKEEMLPDLNPELIGRLQGQWFDETNSEHFIQIARDSVRLVGNRASRTDHLLYLFNDAAAKFFTRDSVFDFSEPKNRNLYSKDFILKETDELSGNTIIYHLIYVSRNELRLDSAGKQVLFQRMQ